MAFIGTLGFEGKSVFIQPFCNSIQFHIPKVGIFTKSIHVPKPNHFKNQSISSQNRKGAK